MSRVDIYGGGLVELRVPGEFVQKCRVVRVEPGDVLRRFVGDLCRSESGGERDDQCALAEAWFDRACPEPETEGANLVDVDAFGCLLDEYVLAGGNAPDLFGVVQKLVDRQQGKDKGEG